MGSFKCSFMQDIDGYIKYSKMTVNRYRVSFGSDENILNKRVVITAHSMNILKTTELQNLSDESSGM